MPLVEGRANSAAYAGFQPGLHQIDAVYAPADPDFDGSHSSLVHAVDQPTTTVVAASVNPAPAGRSVTIAAHVGPLAPAGTVNFLVDGSPAPSCQAIPVDESDATCTLPDLTAGMHEIRAIYCAMVYTTDLGKRRRVSGQTVWSQGGVAAGPLPADSR